MPSPRLDLEAVLADIRRAVEDVSRHGHGRVEVELETNPEGRERAFVRVTKSTMYGVERPKRGT